MDQSLLESLRVVALPTKTNFRGISVREVALFKGEYGWGEFSPFLEYSNEECAPWLASAIEAATKPLPTLFRKSVKSTELFLRQTIRALLIHLLLLTMA
jgi:o-succinylbenzoate synthase